MANIGAFIAADKDVIDYLKYNLRSQMFKQSLPMIQVIGSLKRLELLRNNPELKDKLWKMFMLYKTVYKVFNRRYKYLRYPVYLEGSVPEAMVMVND
jgi:glycine C-acetyltransferase